jgi:hypothetical protein
MASWRTSDRTIGVHLEPGDVQAWVSPQRASSWQKARSNRYVSAALTPGRRQAGGGVEAASPPAYACRLWARRLTGCRGISSRGSSWWVRNMEAMGRRSRKIKRRLLRWLMPGEAYGRLCSVDRAQLRQTQAPIKERYQREPGAALVTLRADGQLDEQEIACSVLSGRARPPRSR